jgi:hypothetical protein
MRRLLFTALAALGMAAPGRAVAQLMPVKPLPRSVVTDVPRRVASSEVIVVARVLALERAPVSVLPYPQAPARQPYYMARVRVTETLMGAPGLKDIRVGSLAPFGSRPQGFLQPVPLAAGQETLFYLGKHPTENFYILVDPPPQARMGSTAFTREVGAVKRCVRLRKDLDAGLKSEDRKDRLFAAGVLIWSFKTSPGVIVGRARIRVEPVAADTSKRILDALAEADWSRKPGADVPDPGRLFDWMQLRPADGWRYGQSKKGWVESNRQTYRFKRTVSVEPPKK